MAKIDLPESWASVVEPLRALLAEVDQPVHPNGSTPPDLTAVSVVRWAQVSGE